MNTQIHVLGVVGARPNFIKMAALETAFYENPRFRFTLVHTGQHYDRELSDLFFSDLCISRPHINLNVGSGSQAEQTARLLATLEPVCQELHPDLVLVVGDANSTLAGALVAAKLKSPIAHVEAGLRSFDHSMPEELNRLVTDTLSDHLFVTEVSGRENLLREGKKPEQIFFVGNVMIDVLCRHREQALARNLIAEWSLEPCRYALLTLHRPSNVDDVGVLAEILDAIALCQKDLPIVFPLHPRTHRRILEFGLEQKLRSMKGVHVCKPLGYLDFLSLMLRAKVVLTDSGGIQEETTYLRIPCITIRENTERPVTLTMGTNCLAGCRKEKIIATWDKALQGDLRESKVPPFWDGKASQRVVDHLEKLYCGG